MTKEIKADGQNWIATKCKSEVPDGKERGISSFWVGTGRNGRKAMIAELANGRFSVMTYIKKNAQN